MNKIVTDEIIKAKNNNKLKGQCFVFVFLTIIFKRFKNNSLQFKYNFETKTYRVINQKAQLARIGHENSIKSRVLSIESACVTYKKYSAVSNLRHQIDPCIKQNESVRH